MDHKLFSKEICKTGFVLENQIAQKLKTAGWEVISNKYYIDDSEETVREIDLVAYRATKVQHFDVFTVLMISCKKSEGNAWALLVRDINLSDPNADWWPLHAWTNDKALQFKLSEAEKARRYHEQLSAMGVAEVLSTPPVEVFAFQEMDKKTGKPQNDKNIFNSITSLIKAQAYELSGLPTRKKTPCIYQFNLLSIIDTELLRLMFRNNEITCLPLESEHYLARYIVRKRETFSRIRFVKSSAFSATLEDYGRLHEANCRWFAKECDAFYEGIMQDGHRSAVLTEDFKNKIHWLITWQLERKFGRKIDFEVLSFTWDKDAQEVGICVGFDTNIISFMNESTEIKGRVSKALKDVFRYEGPFRFTEDIPF